MKAWKSNLAPMGYTGSDPTGNQLGIKKSYQLLYGFFKTSGYQVTWPCIQYCVNFFFMMCFLHIPSTISNPGLSGWPQYWSHTAQGWCVSITLRMQRAHPLLGGNTVSWWSWVTVCKWNTAPSSARILCDHPLCSQSISVIADCWLAESLFLFCKFYFFFLSLMKWNLCNLVIMILMRCWFQSRF